MLNPSSDICEKVREGGNQGTQEELGFNRRSREGEKWL